MSTDQNDEIRSFWKWFESISDELARNFQNRRLLDAVEAQLRRLGPVMWEFGPGTGEKTAFAISPDGDAALLPLTQKIVALSPALPGWEFLPARPAKGEPPTFSFETKGRALVVDSTTWRYVLSRVADQSFDIVIEQVDLPSVSDDDRHAAAVVVIDAVLGEEKRLAFVRDIEPVSAFTENQARRAGSISKLSAHIDSLCRPAARA